MILRISGAILRDMSELSRRRAAAILEVFGIYVAAQLVTALLIHFLHLTPSNPLTTLNAQASNADLLIASQQMLVLLILQYVGFFLLIIPINWWRRRDGAAAYGLTKAGHSWRMLFAAGIATAALCEWPVLIINLLNSVYHEQTAPWRQALFDMSWRRWQFWLFTAILSWALIPVLEELFFRGYCQRRLAEDWGSAAAILATACLFTFAHVQYLILNAYSIGMIVSLLIFAVGFGIIFAWTQSLVPSMMAHAIINFPMTPFWQVVLLVGFVVVLFVARRRGAAVTRQVFSDTGGAVCTALALLGAPYAIIAARLDVLAYIAAAMLAIAVLLEAFEKSPNRRRTLSKLD